MTPAPARGSPIQAQATRTPAAAESRVTRPTGSLLSPPATVTGIASVTQCKPRTKGAVIVTSKTVRAGAATGRDSMVLL